MDNCLHLRENIFVCVEKKWFHLRFISSGIQHFLIGSQNKHHQSTKKQYIKHPNLIYNGFYYSSKKLLATILLTYSTALPSTSKMYTLSLDSFNDLFTLSFINVVSWCHGVIFFLLYFLNFAMFFPLSLLL